MPDDRQILHRLLHLPSNHLANRDQSVEASARRQSNVGVVVVMGVKLESGLSDKLAFEAQHPHFAIAVFHAGLHPVDFAFGYKTDKRRSKSGGFEIYKML